MPQVIVSPAADADLLNIYLYIAKTENSPRGADRLLRSIEKRMTIHAEQPLLGLARPEFGTNIRNFLCGTTASSTSWVVVYRPTTKGIEVLRVFHSKQNYPDLF